MHFRKFHSIIVISLLFLITNLVFSSTAPKVVDNILKSLMETESISHPYYEHYDISLNGEWVAFTIERSFKEDDIYAMGDLRKLPGAIPNTFIRQDIWIVNTKTGKLVRLTNGKPGKNSYWHPVWAPNSRDLAFYGDKDGQIMLWICRNATGQNPPVQEVKGFILKSSLFSRDIPRWTKDGKKLIIPVLPKIEEDAKPGIDDNPRYLVPSIYHKFLDPKGGPTDYVLRSSDKSDINRFLTAENRVDLGILDLRSGRMQRSTSDLDVMIWELSPDEKLIAFKAFKELIPGTSDLIFDLYVMPLKGNSPRLIMENTENGILWSPDSTLLLERKKEELIAVNVQTGEKKIITPSGDLSFAKVFPPPDVLQLSTGSYIWSPEGNKVIAQNKDGWWLLSLEGSPPKKLFKDMDVKVNGILRERKRGNAFSPDGHSVILETFHPKESKKGLFKADLLSDRIEQISQNVPNYSSIFDLYQAEDKNFILYSFAEEEVINLWFSDFSFLSPMKLTDLNLFLKQIPRGKKKLFDYRNLNGEELKGALLLPSDYEEGKRYPLVAFVYAGSIVTTLNRSFPMSFSPVSSISHLLSHCGYIVLEPSIPLSREGQKGSPLKEIPESVLPAVDKVIEMGIADPERVGVIGQSYGGYTVNVLVTQTKRFKAAVSLASFGDLISNYGIFDARWRYSIGGSSFFSSWSEGGQGRMGVPVWEDRMQWIENSPVFYLNKVETPLLLLHGDLDFVSLQQAEEMFSGLKRLDKEVELVRYFGEGHVLSKPANIRDSWRRIIAWFDKYLKAH